MRQTSLSRLAAMGALGFLATAAVAHRVRKRRHPRSVDDYTSTLGPFTNRAEAEAALAGRARLKAALAGKPLDHQERRVYRGRWNRIEARFAGAPRATIDDANALVTELLRARHFDARHVADELEAFSHRFPDLVRALRVVLAEQRAPSDPSASLDVLAARMHSYRRLVRELLDSRDELRLSS